MTMRPIPERHWRSYGNDPLPLPAEALVQPFRAFPSWFLRITCDPSGEVSVLNEAHTTGRRREMPRVLIAVAPAPDVGYDAATFAALLAKARFMTRELAADPLDGGLLFTAGAGTSPVPSNTASLVSGKALRLCPQDRADRRLTVPPTGEQPS